MRNIVFESECECPENKLFPLPEKKDGERLPGGNEQASLNKYSAKGPGY
jgi:hypothetical protein